MDVNDHLNSLEGEFRENEKYEQFVKARANLSRDELLYELFHLESLKDSLLSEMSFMDEELERLRVDLITQKNSASNTATGMSDN